MSFHKESFQTSDNKKLIVLHQKVDTPPEKVILLIHGHGDHGARYENVADFFASKGIATAALTLRGHGLSEGKRGHAPSLNQLILDVEYFIRHMRLKYMEAAFYLYGHSMGGNIVLNYLIRDQSSELTAGIVTSPWIELAFQPPKIKVAIGNIVANIFPTYTENSELNTAEISSIPAEIAEYKRDELNHHKITAKLFQQINLGSKNIQEEYAKINHPVFLAHGALDKITSFEASLKLAEKSTKMNWHPYNHSKHEIHHDVDCQQLFEDIYAWL